MTDTFGNTISSGDVVVYVGTVASINNEAPHYDGLIVNPTYPNSSSSPAGSATQIPAINNSNTGAANSNAQAPDQRAFDGSQVYDITSSATGVYPPTGASTTAVAAGASASAIKASAGKLYRVVVTTLGTASLTFYDNASAASGTILGFIPASAAAGTVFNFLMPAANGIWCASGANTPAVTVSWA